MSMWVWPVAALVLGLLAVEVYLRLQRRAIEQAQSDMWVKTQALLHERISDPARLASLDLVRARIGAQTSYLDMICRSTAAALKSERAIVTLVDGERQQWVASHYVDEAQGAEHEAANGDVPYDRSYCQYVVASDATFIIENAAKDHRVDNHPCFTVLGMKSYLGTPVYSTEGFPVGSLCVFDTKIRKWTERDIVTLESFASLVSL